MCKTRRNQMNTMTWDWTSYNSMTVVAWERVEMRLSLMSTTPKVHLWASHWSTLRDLAVTYSESKSTIWRATLQSKSRNKLKRHPPKHGLLNQANQWHKKVRVLLIAMRHILLKYKDIKDAERKSWTSIKWVIDISTGHMDPKLCRQKSSLRLRTTLI